MNSPKRGRKILANAHPDFERFLKPLSSLPADCRPDDGKTRYSALFADELQIILVQLRDSICRGLNCIV